jgi:23S rRNA-/tRNA-specific pseudouridylate synthase
MMELFHTKKVHKLYLAFVQGELLKEEGCITRHLEENQPEATTGYWNTSTSVQW